MSNTQEKSNSCKGLLRNNESTSDIEQPDFSNGFENRIVDFDYHSQERNINVCSHFIPSPDNKYATLTDSLKSVIHKNSPKLTVVNQTEEAHSSVEKLSKQFVDHLQCSLQESTQNVPLLQTQSQPQQLHFIPESKEEFSNFSNIRSQFEIRSQMYPQEKQNFEKACYVTAEKVSMNNIYQNDNPVSTVANHYVTNQQSSKLSLQSTSPKPRYCSGVFASPLDQKFVTTERQPQYSYNSCPDTVVSAYIKEQTIINPYNPLVDIYSIQNPAKHQRFIQDLTHYQMQHAAQSSTQNIQQSVAVTKTTDKISRRGPKPLVPPRGSSKITYDAGNKTQITNNTPQHTAVQTAYQGPSTFPKKKNALTSSVSQSTIDGENKFITSLTQKPRTRQDGLLDDSRSNFPNENTEPIISNPVYVSKLENRKSIDIATGIKKNNFTIDTNSELIKFDRKTSSAVNMKNALNPIFSSEVKHNENINFLPLDCKESIRSDYMDEYKISMTLDGNRLEDIRKSPMLFVPNPDTLLEQGSQKSPSFQDQQFEKTRQELSAWAEQRQRQEIERGEQQNQFFITSSRSKNQVEERIDEKLVNQFNNRKDMRILPPNIHPVPDISQKVLLEQRRHLRHVSADLTKHIEFTNKEFNDHSISGSVSNLVPTTNVVWVQKVNPTLYNQYPAHSETKIDTKSALTVLTDFGDAIEKPFHQVDHIIHSHRKSHVLSSNLSVYGKNQTDKQVCLETETDCLHPIEQKQFQNQHQSLDYLSNKLKQCEIQQSDLHAKLQCLQNQNQFLDKVAQFQNRQSDVQLHGQYYLIKNKIPENYPTHLLATKIEGTSNTMDEESSTFLYQQQKSLMNQNLLTSSSYTLTSSSQPPNTYDRLSPRLQQRETDDSFASDIPNILYPNQSQLDVNYSSRRSYNQLNRLQDPSNKLTNLQYSSVMMSPSNIHITGTLKKIPPEKPPRTSLIMQNSEIEVNINNNMNSLVIKNLLKV